MLQVGLFHVITDENEIIAVIDAIRSQFAIRIRSLDFYNTVAALYRLS